MNDDFRASDTAKELVRNPEDDWPEPQPLREELPPVLPFDFDLLPTSLRPWLEDIAERTQCPPDYPAIGAMIVLAIVVGRKIGIRPKCKDDWLVVPNLWGAIIGPPSGMKTPALVEAMKPLQRLEVEAKKEFEKAMLEYMAAQLVSKQRRRSAEKDIKDALDGDEAEAMKIARAAIAKESNEPKRRRYLTNDPSVEKLGELLNDNDNGLGVYRDELIGFLKALEKIGQECARAFYLESWNGTGRFTYDRIGRGTIDIEAAIVSIIGSIQPGPLRAYLRSAVAGNEGADGLMQRFQLAVYPDIPSTWINVDRWPDTPARTTAFDAVKGLAALKATDVRAENDPLDPHGIAFLRFDGFAQELFSAWRDQLEHKLRSDTEHAVMVAHLAKYRSLVPSLALLTHLSEGGVGPVGASAAQRAIRWCEYLETHARRIYSIAIVPDTAEAIALSKKILEQKLPEKFALRDIYHNGWIGLADRDSAARAVEALVDWDWLIEVEEETGGRPRKRYIVNPRLKQVAWK